MRNLILLLFPLLLARPALGQQTSFPIRVGGSLQAGVSHWGMTELASYTRFREAYNRMFASELSSPLGDLRPENSFSYGGGFNAGPIYLNFVQHRVTAEASATLANGNRREFLLDFHPLDINFDLMFPAGKRAVLGVALGMELQKARIYSGYRYVGGPLSYAEDHALNGIYDFFSTSAVNIGGRADFKLVRVKKRSLIDLSLRGEYVGAFQKMMGSDLTTKLLPHRDEMTVAASGGYLYDDGTLHKYLVEDPKDQNNDFAYLVGTGGPTFNNIYRGWRFSASIILIPFEWSN